MKKIICVFMTLCLIFLFACSSEEVVHQTVSARPYNDNMTWEVLSETSEIIVSQYEEIADLFLELLELTEKYRSVLNNSETFDWSQNDEFMKLKAKVDAHCDVLLAFEDSAYSSEFQLFLDEVKGFAFKTNKLFDDYAQEQTTEDLVEIIDNYNSNTKESAEKFDAYFEQAIITCLETNGYDKELIERVKQEYSADDKPKIAYSTKSNLFTNEYGTSRTKCVYSTCNNVIASTGDTNCCIIHSNHCLSCGKYIDGDATWCMTCLSDTLS